MVGCRAARGRPDRGLEGRSLPNGNATDEVALLREAGAGPASVVFLAEQRGRARNRPLAVKLLTDRFPRDVDLLFAMRDRGRALLSLGYPGIVGAEDVVAAGTRIGLASAWVDGIDLVEWMEVHRERDERIPGRVAVDLIRGVASALDAARNRVPPMGTTALRTEHRDLKPQNVLLDREGDVRITDFGTGFTSLAGRAARGGTLRAGLSRYLDPMRREGKRGGAESDIYALGIFGLELLRGRWLRRLPAQNPSHDRYLAEAVARLDQLGLRNPTDERLLHMTLLRMVAHDPEARPSAGEAASAMRQIADRALGPSLQTYAVTHVAPLIPAITSLPPAPECDLRVVIDPVEVDSAEEVGNAPLEPAVPGDYPEWEETTDGWLQRAMEELDLDDDDEDISLLTPVPIEIRTAKTSPPAPPREPTPEPAPEANPPPDPVQVRPPTDPAPLLAIAIAGVAGMIVGMALILVILVILTR